ncbi:MAG: MBOAT family protein, partial [Pseudomonas sp.]|nr:MBOAT family protein [Pseudomonas sp.]
YLLWGSAHGIALCVDRLWARSNMPSLPAVLSHSLTLLFVFLAWTLFRAPDFHSAMNMYAGQFGLHDFALGDALAVTLRPVHGLAALLGLACILAPLLQTRCERRFAGHAIFAPVAALWPVAGFMLSFALIASREAVPFLYFQF